MHVVELRRDWISTDRIFNSYIKFNITESKNIV